MIKGDVELLNAFIKVVPHLNKLFLGDAFFDVADTKQIVAYQAGETINVAAGVGSPIAEGGTMRMALDTRQRAEKTVPAEVLGVPCKCIVEPIINEDGEIIGLVGTGSSIENQNRFQGILESFYASFGVLNASIQEIANSAQNLAAIREKLASLTCQSTNDIIMTDEIVQLMRHIADQTKILGLNGAIKAARAGEYGRGFTVITQEIRRLSDESKTSAKQVASSLEQVVKTIKSISQESQETNAVSEAQAAAIEEIAALTQEMAGKLDHLKEFAKLI